METLAMICVITPLCLLALDAGVLVSSIYINEQTCRNAARAASLGAPDAVRKGETLKNATAQISKRPEIFSLVQISPDVQVSESIRKPLPVAPFGGAVNGEVTIVTSAQIQLPFSGSILSQGPIVTHATKTFAFSWIMPSEAR